MTEKVTAQTIRIQISVRCLSSPFKRESNFYLKYNTQMETTGITWTEMGGASKPGY